MCDMKSYWKEEKVGFVGGGNMAKAIGFRLIQKGWLTPNNVWVSARTQDTLAPWASVGANTTLKNHIVLSSSKVVFLAVKPQILDEVISDLKAQHCPLDKLYISVLVGVSLRTLEEKLDMADVNPRIIRSMPNIPGSVGAGITVYCGLNITNHEQASVGELFSCLGLSEIVPESLMNAIGAVSGSGPAYAYVIIEALADGAVRMGVPRALALKIASQVLIGAGQMALETGKHPGQLKDEVCSPGGTTIAGVHAMECGQVRASMMNAIEAAVNKSNQIANNLV